MKKMFTLVVAMTLCSAMSFAQGLGLHGVGGSVGYVSVSGNGGSSTESMGGIVLAAHADLGEITPGFQLVPELQYWSVSKDFGNNITWKFSDFAINANVRYAIKMDGSMKPFVGAGLGFNFYSMTTESPVVNYGFGYSYGGSVSTSATRIGINLIGGANFAMGNLTITPELRYVLASDINHFVIKVGVMVPLGK
jgi:opacity protein-like surface antigen